MEFLGAEKCYSFRDQKRDIAEELCRVTFRHRENNTGMQDMNTLHTILTDPLGVTFALFQKVVTHFSVKKLIMHRPPGGGGVWPLWNPKKMAPNVHRHLWRRASLVVLADPPFRWGSVAVWAKNSPSI